MKSLASIFLLLACSSVSANADIFPHLKAGQPQEVKTLIDRIFICNHLGDEDAYDEERLKALNASAKKYRCNRLEADQAAALKKYKDNPKALKALKTVIAKPY